MQVVLIPAYKPDRRFIELTKELLAAGFSVVAVDDGSGEDCRPFFLEAEAMGVRVATHEINRGKGAAIKTGIRYIMEHFTQIEGVITADCDGRHTKEDILRIARLLKRYPNRMIVGSRFLRKQKIPRSYALTNRFIRVIYHLATGVALQDTQTGLRGIPVRILPSMAFVRGERFEYEMNVLLKLRDWNVHVMEVPITVIYSADHGPYCYNPMRDSWRILKQLFKFCASSMFCYSVDYALFLLFDSLFSGQAGFAYICARVISASMNYYFNSRFVFKNAERKTVVRYFLVAASIAGLGTGGTWFLKAGLHFPSFLCKILVDLPLFVVNYLAQREFVFKKHRVSREV